MKREFKFSIGMKDGLSDPSASRFKGFDTKAKTSRHKDGNDGMIVPVILVLATAIFISVWSYVSISKFLALNAYVFDLGVSAERGWLVLHATHSYYWYFQNLVNSGIVYLISPLTGSGNYYAMLVFQVFAIAMSGPALYKISRKKGLSAWISLFVAVVFFMYFPIYGIFWFDFHYQVFFMPLFIYGYLFYLEKRYVPATIFLILSGMVRFPYSIFPLGFSVVELIVLAKRNELFVVTSRLRSLLTVFFIMLILTTLGYSIVGVLGTVALVAPSQYALSSQGMIPRVFAIFIFLLPLAFLPLLSPRWIIFTFPAFFLILTSNNAAYSYHLILQGQYVAGIAPFLILGFIDSLHRAVKRENSTRVRSPKILPLKRVKARVIAPSAIIVMLILLNLYFCPLGPYNSTSSDNFNYSLNTAYNSTQDKVLSSMLSLIPSNDPYVAYQDNLPQVLPRAMPFGYVTLMGGYLGDLLPFNVSNALNNSWPVTVGPDQVRWVPIDFAIGYAGNADFYHQSQSTYDLMRTMYGSGKYGILSEGDGFMLLEYNYTGSAQDFGNPYRTYNAWDLTNYSGSTNVGEPIVKVNDTSDSFMFYGPGTYLYPGRYNITFQLKASNISAFNNMWLQVTADSGSAFLAFEHINGSWFRAADTWQNFTLEVQTTNIQGLVEFRGFGIEWRGTIAIMQVTINEI